MDEIKTEGIVLRKIPYGDMDSIITFITREGGLLTAFVSKEKVSKKRFGTQLDLFNHLSFTYSAGKKSDMVFLKSCELVSTRDAVRGDLGKFAVVCFFSEFILAFLRDNQAIEGIFTSLISWMNKLEGEEKISPTLLLLMQNHFLSLFGFKPHLSSCTDCTQPLNEANFYRFMSHVGGILCSLCLKGRGESAIGNLLSGQFLKKLEALASMGIESYSFAFSSLEEVASMRRSFDFFIQYQAGKPFKTLSFLEQVLV